MQIAQQREEERGMSLLLRYQGPAVDDGSMNVYDAAANMVAFSDYVVTAAHKLYGDDVIVRAEVTAYKHASFGTDLLFEVMGIAPALVAMYPNLLSVATTVKESIELFLFLKGEEPKRIEHNGDDRSISVTNNNGQITQVNIESLNLTLDYKAGKAIEKFIGEALKKPGVDRIEVSNQEVEIARVGTDDAKFFHPIGAEDTLMEQVVRMGLTIESLSFKDGNKWRMWNGSESLGYSMEDAGFLARVDAGESFRKGDVLICDVLVKQTRTGNVLKMHRAIVKVHDHQIGPEQPDLPLDR